MLILKRKMGEGIDVGDNVRIVLKEINGGHVKIGIEAPTDIRVRRSETATSIEEENLRAANPCLMAAGDLGRLDDIAGTGHPANEAVGKPAAGADPGRRSGWDSSEGGGLDA
jgi:carbon storage regulator